MLVDAWLYAGLCEQLLTCSAQRCVVREEVEAKCEALHCKPDEVKAKREKQ